MASSISLRDAWGDNEVAAKDATVVDTSIENISSEEDDIVNIERWDDFNLKEELLRGIYNYGFENPSPIQKKGILPIVQGRDVLGQAQSGSGKTGTFTIGILQRIDTSVKKTQAVIIAPTHELADQISKVVKSIGNVLEGLKVQTLYGGGRSVSDDAYELRNNKPHVIVGCSGRIFDMIKRGHIAMDEIKIFALDEADEMLSSGFKEQIYNIFQHLSENVQILLFSATMPQDVVELSRKILRNPVRIMMKAEELNLECIQQYYIALPSDSAKYETVKDLFSQLNVGQCIIYVNSVKRVIDLHTAMTEEGFAVGAFHSSMTREERETEIGLFRKGEYRVLISSNITSRGIDVQQVSTVINFDIPKCVHTYLHRIGRSGRWGRKGMAINFVTRQDVQLLRNIERYYKSDIKELPAVF